MKLTKPRLQDVRSERGQVLVLFVVVLTLVFLIGAIAIDYGFWLSERRGLARASDLSALAAVQDLPPRDADNNPVPVNPVNDDVADCGGVDACVHAFDWAERNGYGEGSSADVTVEFWCGNTIPVPHDIEGICENTFPGALSPCDTGCDAVRVIVERPAVRLFSGWFGNGPLFNVQYASWGGVTFKVIPLDTAIGVDATGSMGESPPCNGSDTNPGCPIKEARDAANGFVDVLLDGATGISQVGSAPYRDCYGGSGWAGNNCVPNSSVVQLTSNETPLHTAINGTVANSSTNICVGLAKLREILNGPNASDDEDARRFAVILTDGDNSYRSDSSPIAACNPTGGMGPGGGGCDTSAPNATERNMDELTYDMATAMKEEDPPIEIYVIGFSVCGSSSNATFTQAQCDNLIGNNANDNTADRRLLKCMASSSDGTNDHYFEVNNAADLPDIFQVVAYEIASGGLTTGAP